MLKYILKRIFKSVLTIWFIMTVVFIFTRLSGDPTLWILADDATDAEREQCRQELGLDQPLYKQYWDVLTSLLTGNAGKSYNYRRPVSELYNERIGATFKLALTSFGISVALGLIFGVFSAVKRNSIFDRMTVFFSIIGSTIPGFVLCILLIFLFALKLGWLPSAGMDGWKSFVMPVICSCVGSLASITRLTRSSLLDVLRQDYLDCARAKGVSSKIVLFKHALRNALIPVVTIVGLQLGGMIGGAVVVETVFSWPGVGTLLINGAKIRDYPIVIYGVMLISVCVTTMTLLVDISYSLLDPRIRDKA